MDRIFLSLGSNVGDRQRNIEDALARLEAEDIRIAARSSLYETEPQDFADQPWFLNMVAACETDHAPQRLLAILLKVEREGGRIRGTRLKGPRAIDIDIVLYRGEIIETPQLTVPHPRMLARRFVLDPLVEIAPELRHPVTGLPLRSYLNNVADQQIRKVPPA